MITGRWQSDQVKYFIDTEFIDRERFIDLISLGVVAEDGREFYAISTEFDPAHANTFVRTVVIPQWRRPNTPHGCRGSK